MSASKQSKQFIISKHARPPTVYQILKVVDFETPDTYKSKIYQSTPLIDYRGQPSRTITDVLAECDLLCQDSDLAPQQIKLLKELKTLLQQYTTQTQDG